MAGLTSRWTRPAAWIASRPLPTWAISATAVARLEAALAGDPAAEVRAGDVAHRDEGDAVLFAGGVDRHHVGVLDRGGDPRLLGEAPGEDLFGGRLGRDQLQRHAPLEAGLDRQVEDAHAAAAEAALDPVAGELVARATARSSREPQPSLNPSRRIRRLDWTAAMRHRAAHPASICIVVLGLLGAGLAQGELSQAGNAADLLQRPTSLPARCRATGRRRSPSTSRARSAPPTAATRRRCGEVEIALNRNGRLSTGACRPAPPPELQSTSTEAALDALPPRSRRTRQLRRRSRIPELEPFPADGQDARLLRQPAEGEPALMLHLYGDDPGAGHLRPAADDLAARRRAVRNRPLGAGSRASPAASARSPRST